MSRNRKPKEELIYLGLMIYYALNAEEEQKHSGAHPYA